MTAIGAVADWQLAASAVMTVNDRHWVDNGHLPNDLTASFDPQRKVGRSFLPSMAGDRSSALGRARLRLVTMSLSSPMRSP